MRDVEKSGPKDDEVLIKVRAAFITRFLLGLRELIITPGKDVDGLRKRLD